MTPSSTPHRDTQLDEAVISKACKINDAISVTVCGLLGNETPECAESWKTAVLIADLQVRLEALEADIAAAGQAFDMASAKLTAEREEEASPQPTLSEVEARDLWAETTSIGPTEATRHIYKAGHKAGWAAALELEPGVRLSPSSAKAIKRLAEPHRAATSPAPASSLVDAVVEAIVDGMVESDRTAACDAIRAVADWLDGREYYGAPALLREEADR